MKTGMLWFDNNLKIDLPTKILKAAIYYQNKYGHKPDLCYIHPSMMGTEPVNTIGIEVKTNLIILPNHLWLGVHPKISH